MFAEMSLLLCKAFISVCHPSPNTFPLLFLSLLNYIHIVSESILQGYHVSVCLCHWGLGGWGEPSGGQQGVGGECQGAEILSPSLPPWPAGNVLCDHPI